MKKYVHTVKNIRGSPGMKKSVYTPGPQTPFPEATSYEVPYQESMQVGAYMYSQPLGRFGLSA